jgi:hypothetical protein
MSHQLIGAASIGRVLCTVCLTIVIGRSVAADEIVERCGLGPPPDSANFNSYNEERERIRALVGYEPVCEQYIATLPPPSPLEPFEAVRSKLAFQPIPLEGTPFATFRPLGASADIIGDKRGAKALRRYFAASDGEFLELFEVDTALAGGVYVLYPERHTERVRGQLAMLTVEQSKSGKVLSVLSWEENRRHIELSINRNVRRLGYAQFMHLAESLPAPSPAQPNAPIPKPDLPPPFGPGVPIPPESPVEDSPAHPPK